MAEFYIEEHPCPHCGARTEVRRLVSTDGYVGVDLDYRVYAAAEDPVRRLLTRCAQCAFTEYVTDFPKELPAYVHADLDGPEYRALARADLASDYPLVARVKRTKREPQERIAYCHLRASWFCGDSNQREEEERHLESAADCFERALSGRLDAQVRDRTHYMLGEIYRRLGRFARAGAHLERVAGDDFERLVAQQARLIKGADTTRRRAPNQ